MKNRIEWIEYLKGLTSKEVNETFPLMAQDLGNIVAND